MSKNHKILENDSLNIFSVYGKALDLQEKINCVYSGFKKEAADN